MTSSRPQRLLRQLLVLKIDWGKPQKASGGKGTFDWKLQWDVEFRCASASECLGQHGQEAATAFCARAATMPPTFRPERALDQAIWPVCPRRSITSCPRALAVGGHRRYRRDDESLPALARVARYGDVRGTAAADVMPVIDALFQRVIVGLPGAVSSLDDSAAEAIVQSMGEVTASVGLLDNPDMRADWQLIMRKLADLEGCHGLVRGVACRLLVEQQVIDEAELRRRARLALSPANRIAFTAPCGSR
jgi:hypothetical protein